MDPLTQLIKLLHPSTLRWKRLNAFGDWTLQFSAHAGISFCMVGRGSCQIQLAGDERRHLGEGDLVLLNAPSSWTLLHGVAAPLEDFESAYAGADGRPSVVGKTGSGPLTQLLGGEISFDAANAKLFKGVLPAMMWVGASEPFTDRLRKVLELIGDEAVSDRPGRGLILERLLEVMLVEAIRSEPLDPGKMRHGLLAGLAEPQLAKALRIMHTEFQGAWTVSQLAAISGMSRSVFADRFSRVVGLAPIDYLLELRMAVAKDALRFSGSRPAEVAFRCGYKSVAAFSTAFRRSVGCSPGAYAKERVPQIG